MRDKSDAPIEQAARHTAIIRDPAAMWSKLAWDVDQFRDIQVSYPEEQEPLAFAAINVCIAAWSLRNWVQSVRARQMRRLNVKFDRDAFLTDIFAAIPEQAACEAIANTAKHAHYGEGRWPGGEVHLYWAVGDEDEPEGYVLHHLKEDGQHEGMAVNRFTSLLDNWWAYLSANSMVIGACRTPQWQQNKLKQIWGDPEDRPLPPDQK